MNELEGHQPRSLPDRKTDRNDGGHTDTQDQIFGETRLPKSLLVTIRNLFIISGLIGGYNSLLSRAKDFDIEQAKLLEYRVQQLEQKLGELDKKVQDRWYYEQAPDYEPKKRRK